MASESVISSKNLANKKNQSLNKLENRNISRKNMTNNPALQKGRYEPHEFFTIDKETPTINKLITVENAPILTKEGIPAIYNVKIK